MSQSLAKYPSEREIQTPTQRAPKQQQPKRQLTAIEAVEPPPKRTKIADVANLNESSITTGTSAVGSSQKSGDGSNISSPPATLPEGDLSVSILKARQEGNTAAILELISASLSQLTRNPTDHSLYLALMYVAKVAPDVFTREGVWEHMINYLKHDQAIHFKRNTTVPILVCNLLNKSFESVEIWPVEFVQVFLEDSFADRFWVDEELNRPFVENILTVFPSIMEDPSFSEPGSKVDLEPKAASTNRFPNDILRDTVRSYIGQIIQYHLAQSQRPDKNIIRVMLVTIGYPEVRHLASFHIPEWLHNMAISRSAKELLRRIVVNCRDSSEYDVDTVRVLIQSKVKPSFQPFFMECISRLLQNNSIFPAIALRTFVETELLSTSQEVNNKQLKSILSAMKENRELEIASVLQELSLNSSNTSVLRKVATTIFKAISPRIDIIALCSAMFKCDPHALKELDEPVKVQYINNIVEIVITFAILSAPHELIAEQKSATAANTSSKDKRIMLRQWRQQMAKFQMEGIIWCHKVVPAVMQSQSQAISLERIVRKLLMLEPVQTYFAEPDRGEGIRVMELFSLMPVEEDTLIHLILLAREPTADLQPSAALDIIESIIKRAAEFYRLLPADEKVDPMKASNQQLPQALLQLAQLYAPNIPPETPPLVYAEKYWQEWLLLVLLSAFNPTTIGRMVWDTMPTARTLMEMTISRNFVFPPIVSADSTKKIESLSQVEEAEVRTVRAVEAALLGTSGQPQSLGYLMLFEPTGVARRPPQHIIDKLKQWDQIYRIGYLLSTSKDSYFIVSLMRTEGSEALNWLWPIIGSDPETIAVLPSHCLSQLLLTATSASPGSRSITTVEQVSTILRLLRGGFAPTSAPTKTLEILDFFLSKLYSQNKQDRIAANIALYRLLDEQQSATNFFDSIMHWLRATETLPHHKLAKELIKDALYSAISVETDCLSLAAYITYLHDRGLSSHQKPSFGLAAELGRLLVQRPFVARELFYFRPTIHAIALRTFLVVLESSTDGKYTDRITVTWPNKPAKLYIGKTVFLGALEILRYEVPDDAKLRELYHQCATLLFPFVNTENSQVAVPEASDLSGAKIEIMTPQRANAYASSISPNLVVAGLAHLTDEEKFALLTAHNTSRECISRVASYFEQLAKSRRLHASWIEKQLSKSTFNGAPDMFIQHLGALGLSDACSAVMSLLRQLKSMEPKKPTKLTESSRHDHEERIPSIDYLPQTLKQISGLPLPERIKELAVALFLSPTSASGVDPDMALVYLTELLQTSTTSEHAKIFLESLMVLTSPALFDSMGDKPTATLQVFMLCRDAALFDKEFATTLIRDFATFSKELHTRNADVAIQLQQLKEQLEQLYAHSSSQQPQKSSETSQSTITLSQLLQLDPRRIRELIEKSRVKITLDAHMNPIQISAAVEALCSVSLTHDTAQDLGHAIVDANVFSIFVDVLRSHCREPINNDLMTNIIRGLLLAIQRLANDNDRKIFVPRLVELLLEMHPENCDEFIECTFAKDNTHSFPCKPQFLSFLLHNTQWDTRNKCLLYILNHSAAAKSLDPTTALDFIGGLLYHMDTVTSVIDAHQVSETRFSTPPTYHTFTESQINTLADLVLAEMVQTSRADEPNSMPAEVHRHIRLLFACASQSDTLLKSLVKHFARTPSSQSPATQWLTTMLGDNSSKVVQASYPVGSVMSTSSKMSEKLLQRLYSEFPLLAESTAKAGV